MIVCVNHGFRELGGISVGLGGQKLLMNGILSRQNIYVHTYMGAIVTCSDGICAAVHKDGICIPVPVQESERRALGDLLYNALLF